MVYRRYNINNPDLPPALLDVHYVNVGRIRRAAAEEAVNVDGVGVD